MLSRLVLLGLVLTTLAGCYVAPARPYYGGYGYGYGGGYYAPRPYYGGWGRPYGYSRW